MGEPLNQSERLSSRRGLLALLEAMRPSHWIKNVFVAAAILFAEKFADFDAWLACLSAIGSFSLLASAAYLINDLCDRRADRAHPDKRRRPIASGRLSPAWAAVGTVMLVLGGALLAIVVATQGRTTFRLRWDDWFLWWSGAYLALNLLYSFRMKHYVIVDVVVVALGFVLRAMGGAAAIAVPISPWLVVCTFTLCLFLALSKRRGEILQLPPDQAGASRATNRAYDLGELDRMLTISAALAIVTYSLYCLAPQTVARIGSGHMVWTIPVVIYGIFRFDRVSRRVHKGDLVSVFFRDRILWLVCILYVALAVLVIRFGDHPAVRSILDAGGGR